MDSLVAWLPPAAPSPQALLLFLAVAACSCCLLCARHIRNGGLPWARPPAAALRTMVVLGSGGHTAEMLALLAAMDLGAYCPRIYVVAATDNVSAAKAHAFEAAHGRGSSYEVHTIRRSREVGQSFSSSVWTTGLALLDAMALVSASRPQLVLCNGPGTCLPLVAASVALRAVGPSRACGCVYVESVARVQHLSLTGRLLYSLRLADAFFVQWEALVRAHPRAVCLGRLM